MKPCPHYPKAPKLWLARQQNIKLLILSGRASCYLLASNVNTIHVLGSDVEFIGFYETITTIQEQLVELIDKRLLNNWLGAWPLVQRYGEKECKEITH